MRYDAILDGRRRGRGRRRPDHPREPLHLRRPRPRRGRRPRRLVGGRDRACPCRWPRSARGSTSDAELRAGAQDALRRSVEHAFAHPLDSLDVRARALPGDVRRGLPPAHRSVRQRVHPSTSATTGWPRSTRCSPAPSSPPRDQRALARGRRRRAPAGRARAAALRLVRLLAHPRHAAAAVRRGRGREPADRRAARARRARRRASSPCSSTRSAGRSCSASPSARRCSRGCAADGVRLEADDAVPLDDDRARDDAAHGAAGRASTAPTSGSCTSRRSTASSAR